MAINKRLRFEILRRDGFRCTYCGASPAERELQVDHVIPAALGGTDDPQNLTTSCEPCNSGKSATPPDAEIIAAVDKAVAIELAARQQIAARAIEYSDSLDTFEDEVRGLWDFHVPQYRSRYTPGFDLARIAEWHDANVPLGLIEFGIRIAVAADVAWAGKSAYATAVVRNKLRQIGEEQ